MSYIPLIVSLPFILRRPASPPLSPYFHHTSYLLSSVPHFFIISLPFCRLSTQSMCEKFRGESGCAWLENVMATVIAFPKSAPTEVNILFDCITVYMHSLPMDLPVVHTTRSPLNCVAFGGDVFRQRDVLFLCAPLADCSSSSAHPLPPLRPKYMI